MPHVSRLCKAWPRATRPFERCTGVEPASAAWEAAALTVVRTPRLASDGRKGRESPVPAPRASDGIRTHSLPLRRRTHDPLCFQGFGTAFVHACGAGGVVLTSGKEDGSPCGGCCAERCCCRCCLPFGEVWSHPTRRPVPSWVPGRMLRVLRGIRTRFRRCCCWGKVSGGTVFGKDEVGACGNVTRVFRRLPCECALAGLRPEVREAHRHRSRPGKGALREMPRLGGVDAHRPHHGGLSGAAGNRTRIRPCLYAATLSTRFA